MCKLFVHADPCLWQTTQKSLRIDGVVTSVRLENTFWEVLEEISQRDNLTVPALVTRLFYESVEVGHDMGNFTSFLRVCCARYFSLQLSGHITRDKSISILSLDADKILSEEKLSRSAR
ncbi:MAG: ribbon-helix-helix domain-containing protein [Cellvibrionaceae bacterium]